MKFNTKNIIYSNFFAQFSEQMALAIAPLLAVIMLNATASDTAWLQTSQTLPFLLLSIGDNIEQLLQDFQDIYPNAELVANDTDFNVLVAHVLEKIEMPKTQLQLPLDIQGTAFQQKIWQALMKIPVGETRNYTEIAELIGQPTAARAVAQSCANNRLAVAIPCHRVVRKNGDLSGYKWGVGRKRTLLEREQSNKL